MILSSGSSSSPHQYLQQVVQKICVVQMYIYDAIQNMCIWYTMRYKYVTYAVQDTNE